MITDKKQIFIVDDDVSVCRALSILLGTYGFKVDTFTSAVKFLSVVSDNIPGCLILDIHMPVLDGWQTLKQLPASGHRRPVIIISADKNGGLCEKAVKAGAAGFLQKPFDDQVLIDLIRVAFEKGGKEYGA